MNKRNTTKSSAQTSVWLEKLQKDISEFDKKDKKELDIPPTHRSMSIKFSETTQRSSNTKRVNQYFWIPENGPERKIKSPPS